MKQVKKNTNSKQANQIRGLKSDINKLSIKIVSLSKDLSTLWTVINSIDVAKEPCSSGKECKHRTKDAAIDFILICSACAAGVVLGAWIAL